MAEIFAVSRKVQSCVQSHDDEDAPALIERENRRKVGARRSARAPFALSTWTRVQPRVLAGDPSAVTSAFLLFPLFFFFSCPLLLTHRRDTLFFSLLPLASSYVRPFFTQPRSARFTYRVSRRKSPRAKIRGKDICITFKENNRISFPECPLDLHISLVFFLFRCNFYVAKQS